jgi:GDP-4-dehydro-6-deoxy-D-mannose reductase
MRVLVTGATGFAGGHLIEALLARGDTVIGVARRSTWPEELRHFAGRIELRSGDLADGSDIEAVVRDFRPEQIYHLAGYSQPGRSCQEPDAAWAGNLKATRALYDAVVCWGGRPRILFVGSGLIYGNSTSPDVALDENSPLRPNTPYAASKAAADLATYQYTCHPGLDIVRVRPFNHIGPRQSPQFAAAGFARQLALIQAGRAPPQLETGDLTPSRDLTDVRDVIAAYLLLLERGRSGDVYNLASGQVVSMRDVVDRLIALVGMKVELWRSEDRLRAADVNVLRVDAGKLRREIGWHPRFTLDQTLSDILAYWRALV